MTDLDEEHGQTACTIDRDGLLGKIISTNDWPGQIAGGDICPNHSSQLCVLVIRPGHSSQPLVPVVRLSPWSQSCVKVAGLGCPGRLFRSIVPDVCPGHASQWFVPILLSSDSSLSCFPVTVSAHSAGPRVLVLCPGRIARGPRTSWEE